MVSLDAIDWALLDDFQQTMPLVSRPFAAMGAALGLDEAEVLVRLTRLKQAGAISRIGAVLPPRRFGESTLAALQVPPERLEEVAATVNGFAEVNHNYLREHRYNMWFVATAKDSAALAATLASISAQTGLAVLDLPLAEEYHIDLGFPLRNPPSEARRVALPEPCAFVLDEREQLLAHLVNEGLALAPEPFAAIAAKAGYGEAETLQVLERLMASGAIKRLGVIVRHHELGIVHNAMCVWDIPDERVSAIGREMARYPVVNLCYRRPRRLPHWPYNLFCMVHGRDRDTVRQAVAGVAAQLCLHSYDHDMLFSIRRFKQRGARYRIEAA